jgi:hypothetical protein
MLKMISRLMRPLAAVLLLALGASLLTGCATAPADEQETRERGGGGD